MAFLLGDFNALTSILTFAMFLQTVNATFPTKINLTWLFFQITYFLIRRRYFPLENNNNNTRGRTLS